MIDAAYIEGMTKTGRINGMIKKLCDESNSPIVTYRNSVLKEIQRILSTDSLSVRVTGKTVEYVKKILPDFTEFPSYKINNGEVGKTYLLLANNSDGGCHFLKVSTSEVGSKIPGHIINCIDSLVNKYKLPDLFFNKNVIDRLRFNLVDYRDNLLKDIEIRGNSFELSLAVSLFSYIAQITIPGDVAFTGTVTELDGKISLVNGTKMKIDALKEEYPEVKKVFLPEQLAVISNGKDVLILNATTVEQVLLDVFPQISENNLNEYLGKLCFEKNQIQINAEKTAQLLSFTHEQGLSYGLISQIKNIVPHLDLDSNKILLVDNLRAGWLLAAFVAEIKNIVPAIAINDNGKYVIVFAKDNQFKAGEIIK